MRNGMNRSCGNSARIEGERQKSFVNEEGEDKCHRIKSDHNSGEIPVKYNTHYRDYKEYSHTDGYGEYQYHILKSAYLLCKELKIGLGNCDKNTDNKADESDNPYFFTSTDCCAYFRSERLHRHFSTRGEKAHSEDKADNAHQKQEHVSGRNRYDCDAEGNYYQRNRQNRFQ